MLCTVQKELGKDSSMLGKIGLLGEDSNMLEIYMYSVGQKKSELKNWLLRHDDHLKLHI